MNSNFDYEQRDNSYIVNNISNSKGLKVFTPVTNFNFGGHKQKSCEELPLSHVKESCQISDELGRQKSTSNSVSSYLDRRHRESQQRIIKLKQKIQTEEKNVMTFKPSISSNSRKIVEKLMIGEKRTPYNFHEIISQQNYKPPCLPNKEKTEHPVKVKESYSQCEKQQPSQNLQRNITQSKAESSSKRGTSFNLSTNQSASPNKTNASVSMSKDLSQEDYKKIMQNRSNILKAKGVKTPQKFETDTNSKHCKSSSSRRLHSEKAKPNNDQSTSANLNTSTASVHYTNNNHQSRASYSKNNISFNYSEIDKSAYNIFKAQPVEKIVDARSKLNYFYRAQCPGVAIVPKSMQHGPSQASIQDQKQQQSKGKSNDGLCSYSNYKEEMINSENQSPVLFINDYNHSKINDISNSKTSDKSNDKKDVNMFKRFNDLDHLKSFANMITNSKSKEHLVPVNKNRPLDFTLGGSNQNTLKQSPDPYSNQHIDKDELIYSIPRQSPISENIKQKSIQPSNIQLDSNEQYKLDSASKEYLFQKLKHMKSTQISNY